MVFILAFRSCFLPVWLNVSENDMEYESHRPFWHFFDLKAYLYDGLHEGLRNRLQGTWNFSGYIRCFFLFRAGLCFGIGRHSFYKKLFLLQQIDK